MVPVSIDVSNHWIVTRKRVCIKMKQGESTRKRNIRNRYEKMMDTVAAIAEVTTPTMLLRLGKALFINKNSDPLA